MNRKFAGVLLGFGVFCLAGCSLVSAAETGSLTEKVVDALHASVQHDPWDGRLCADCRREHGGTAGGGGQRLTAGGKDQDGPHVYVRYP